MTAEAADVAAEPTALPVRRTAEPTQLASSPSPGSSSSPARRGIHARQGQRMMGGVAPRQRVPCQPVRHAELPSASSSLRSRALDSSQLSPYRGRAAPCAAAALGPCFHCCHWLSCPCCISSCCRRHRASQLRCSPPGPPPPAPPFDAASRGAGECCGSGSHHSCTARAPRCGVARVAADSWAWRSAEVCALGDCCPGWTH